MCITWKLEPSLHKIRLKCLSLINEGGKVLAIISLASLVSSVSSLTGLGAELGQAELQSQFVFSPVPWQAVIKCADQVVGRGHNVSADDRTLAHFIVQTFSEVSEVVNIKQNS